MTADRSTDWKIVAPTVGALVEQLMAAMTHARQHELSHPRVATPVAAVQGCLRRIERELGQRCLDLLLEGERIVLGGAVELPRTPATTRLAHALRGRASSGLRLSTRAHPADFSMLFTILMAPQDAERRSLAELNDQLSRISADRVELLAKAGVSSTGSEAIASGNERGKDALASTGRTGPRRAPPTREHRLVSVARDAFTTATEGTGLALQPIVDEVASFVARTIDRDSVAMDLSLRGHEDPDGAWHAGRTCALTIEAARSFCDDPDLLVRLGVAALLHDIGESLLPPAARRSGPHGSAEHRVVWQSHTELGAEYLLGSPDADPLWVAAALTHHRNQIGGGHPRMHHDHVQSAFVQLIRIADAYEALTAPAPHRDPLTPTHAFRSLIAARGELSTTMLRRFIEALGLRPTGSVVRLTNGELARVVRQGDDIEHPVVVIVATAQGRRIPPEQRRTLDLSRPDPGAPRLAGSY